MKKLRSSNPLKRFLRPALLLTAGLALLLLLDGPAQAAPSPTQLHDDFYGLNFVSPGEPWLTLARESGAGLVRWQFNWRDHEPEPDVWTWSQGDAAIQAWEDAGLGIHALLHYPPDWALATPGGLVPANANLPWDHPDNHWSHYCNTFASRYQGRIASYEVWNEPDLDIYWESSAQEYFYVLRSCYMGIKAADPDVPVAMAGMALLIDEDFFPEVVQAAYNDPAGADHNYYFDAAAIHTYVSPELAYSLTRQTRDLLSLYGMGDKPIWITETSIPLRGEGIAPDYPYWRYASEEEAAWYLLQTASNALAAGADRLMWFRLTDDGMDEAFGLTNWDSTRRTSYQAYQLAASLMVDIVEAQREVRDGVVITTMRRADGARIITMYSVTGVTVDLSVEAEASLGVLINPLGGHSTIRPGADRAYEVTLLPARGRDLSRSEDYSVGGPPLIIVEFDKDGPAAALTASISPENPMLVNLAWWGDDGLYGTGVASYDIETRHEGGAWDPFLTGTTDTEAVFEMTEDGDYAFRVRATDQMGNAGLFTEPVSAGLYGHLVAHVIDLRGQSVPHARVEMADGSLHDADESGIIRIDLPAGAHAFRSLDGSAHGVAAPAPVTVALGEETHVTWQLVPAVNLIENGDFERGLVGWTVSPGHEIQSYALNDVNGRVLRLAGPRRAWGVPAVGMTIEIPAEMQDGVLSFMYRMPVEGQVLRVRAIGPAGQQTLWYTEATEVQFRQVAVDMSACAGQRVTLRFELWGRKTGSGSSIAELDGIRLSSVPVLVDWQP